MYYKYYYLLKMCMNIFSNVYFLLCVSIIFTYQNIHYFIKFAVKFIKDEILNLKTLINLQNGWKTKILHSQ